jgi:hypothetical protein
VSKTTNKENADHCLKEKMKRAAEQSLTKTITEADKKREEEKWRLAEEKAAEEWAVTEKRDEERKLEKGKKDQEEAEKMAAKKDMLSGGNTDGHTSPATNLGVKREDAAGQLTDSREAGDSPERKKLKQSSPTAASLIESGWYMVAKVSTPTLHPLNNHVHKRVILDAALELNKDNPITSFPNGLCVLINNTKMVNNHFAICPVKEGGSEMWHLAGDIPKT